MFSLIPWLDEVYIVEMGRLFLSGGDVDSILLGRSDVVLMPFCYLGPCLQELAFRIGGLVGARLCPFVGLLLAYWGFRTWLKRCCVIPRIPRELFALTFLFSPLLFQCALLTRVDTWALACVFGSLAALGRPDDPKSLRALAFGAFLAVCSVFVWPTAAILAFVYPVFAFSLKRRQAFFLFCLFAAASVVVLLMPFAARPPTLFASFGRHYAESTSPVRSVSNVIEPLAREVARSPFMACLAGVGLLHCMLKRRWVKVIVSIQVFAVAALAGLYTFRIVYLLPLLLLLAAEFLEDLTRRRPRFVIVALSLCVAYGVLTGPVGHCLISHPTLPEGLENQLAEVVGTGPVRVFAPDHFAYYIGRKLGWKQIGCAKPSELNDPAVLTHLLSGCEAAVIRDVDSFTPFQQSCTPYGLFCRYIFDKARSEASLPLEQRSWAARLGSRFSFAWHGPLTLEGCEEVAQIGFARVYRRKQN